MASTQTTNLGLVKQDYNDYTSVFDLNDNMDKIDAAIAGENILITVTDLSVLPHTIVNNKITASHRVVMSTISNNLAMSGTEWQYQTSDGSVKITGTISGSTDLNMYLMKVY